MANAGVAAPPTAPAAEKPILDYVPESLNRLAVLVAKVFLGREHHVVMDYVIKQVCIREEDLRSLLKLDLKFMRQLILQLKQDKLVKERQATEEYEGRPRRISYYFTNYRAIVNVAKYKIDHMRQRLEAREKTKVHRATYKCSGCEQSYDALDMDKIYNPSTGVLSCWRCGQDVEVDNTVGPSTETRSMLAKFNEQMTALFSMIQQLDGVQLAPHLLEPRLPAATIVVQQQTETKHRVQVGGRAFNGGEATRSDMFNTEIGIRVTIDDGANTGEDQTTEKEVVPWLAAAQGSASLDGTSDAVADVSAPAMKRVKLQDDDILGLLREELENPSASQSPSASNQVSMSVPQPESSLGIPSGGLDARGPTDFSSMVQDEAMASGDDSGEEDTEEFVHVQGVKYPIGAITTELVEKMTEAEKKHYTEISMHQYDY